MRDVTETSENKNELAEQKYSDLTLPYKSLYYSLKIIKEYFKHQKVSDEVDHHKK